MMLMPPDRLHVAHMARTASELNASDHFASLPALVSPARSLPAHRRPAAAGSLSPTRQTGKRGGRITGSPMRATGGSYDRLAGAMTFAEIAKVGKLLFRELSTPALPPLSTGANGAIVATATPADASAAASSVVPAGDGRSPLGDSSDCGLHGTSVPLNGAAMSTPRSLFDDVGGCLALPTIENLNQHPN